MAHIWGKAHKAHIKEWDPLMHGWMKDEKTGKFVPHWFKGKRVPDNLFHEEIDMQDNDMSDSDNDEDSDSDVGSSSESHISS